ncbi:MAG: hypothetical protein M1836_006695 [Candelina mexicana]|nr:MAG: hypothetical protein M1836_006695 [Candelina mexicana]
MRSFTLLAFIFLATLSAVFAFPGQDISERETACIALGTCPPDIKKACSGDRTEDDVCQGKKLQPQNSFHNCGNQGGKCCAANADGTGGLPTSSGGNREDCGYCFSGKYADSAITDILARAAENGELENLINKRDIDIQGIPHRGVTCPRTPKANKPDKSPGKQKISKEQIEADIKDYGKKNPDKKDGYPKKFDDHRVDAGDFHFDNGCEKDKILELPVGPAGQKWKDMGSDSGDFRLMIQVKDDNNKVTLRRFRPCKSRGYGQVHQMR